MIERNPQDEQAIPWQKIFKCCFSTVYGLNSKNDEIAGFFYNSMIEYLSEHQLMFSKEKQRQILKDLLTKTSLSAPQQSLKVHFKCEYGCAVVLTKEKDQSPINIRIIAPEEWSTGACSWRDKNLDFQEPKNFTSYYIPELSENTKSIEKFYPVFCQKLEIAIGRVEGQEKMKDDSQKMGEYSPKIIEKACQYVKDGYIYIYSSLKNQNEDEMDEGEKCYAAIGQSFILNESNANTSWYIPEIVALALIKSNQKYSQFSEKLIIGYKAYLLEKVIKQQTQYKRVEVMKYKQCLDYLIHRYKYNLSKEKTKANRCQDFQNVIAQIKKNLDELTHNGLTSSIDNDSFIEKQKGLEFEKTQKANLVYPHIQEPKKSEVDLVQIDDFPMIVKDRLPFEELLMIHERIELIKGEDSLQLKSAEEDKWILLVEKIFFKIADQFATNEKIIDLRIHMREIQCEIGGSNLNQVIQKYQNIVKKNSKHFGMMMEGQTKSHIQLIKTIGAIIAFQSVKMNRQRKKSNLDDYKVPIDIEKFSQEFISHSYEARRAMKKLRVYNEYRKDRNIIFLLDGGSQSFAQFGRQAAKETRSAHVWVKKMQQMIELKQQIEYHKMKTQQAETKTNSAIEYLRSAIQYPNNYSGNFQSRKQYILSQRIPYYSNQIYNEYNPNDPWLHAFVENIPSDILGLVKCLFVAQNPKQGIEKKNNLFSNCFVGQDFPITIYSEPPRAPNHTVYSNDASAKNMPLVNLFNDVCLMYGDSQEGAKIGDKAYFIQQRDLIALNEEERNSYSFIYTPNTDQNYDREHLLYSNLNLKPKDMEIQEFLGIGNVRSGQHTQLMVLCLNILQKKITTNSYDKTCRLAQQTFLQTAGQLSTYHPEIQKHFQQIRNMIKNIIRYWAFTDVNFCPILGPFLGYISRQLADDEIPREDEKEILENICFEICKKCVEEIERGEKQLQKNSDLTIQWDQRFVCTAAICCFREIKLKANDEQKLMKLCELIFQLRTYKILSDRQEKPKKKRPFEKELLFSVEKAIFSNIEAISNLLNGQPDRIGEIIKKMDPSYPDDVHWERKNLFSFTGRSQQGQDVYQIDIFAGKIFKNGKEVSALDKVIKQNPNFKSIFGSEREFQVFQSPSPHYLRTKKSVNHQFKIPESLGLIFFEFSEDGQYIRHVFKRPGDNSKQEETWTLIPSHQLKSKSTCYLPKLFRQNHFAWYSQKRKCVVFRKIKFQEMFNVGMVVHLDNPDNLAKPPGIRKAFYITYHGSFENQNLDELCDINTKKYDEIILRSKSKQSKKLNQIKQFHILERFQSPDYIFELKNKNTQQIEYLLHRYQLKFKLEDQTRLISESNFGYSVEHGFYDDDRVIFNRFPCLVLYKYSKNPAIMNSHKRIILLSSGKVESDGKIHKSTKADVHIKSFKYEIHDFFHDFRGMNRESLLHLATIMLSINDNIKISSLEMTPLQYAFYLISSCFNNSPTNKEQNQIILNIIKSESLQAPQSIVLLCEGIYGCGSVLKKILPFSKQQDLYQLKSCEENFMTCRTLYEKKYNCESVKYRERMNRDILQFLGLKIIRRCNDSDSSSSSESSEEDYNDIYWRKVQKFTGENIIRAERDIKAMFEEFEAQQKRMNIWDEKINVKIKDKDRFPQTIEKLVDDPKANEMMKEMVTELKESYNTFIEEEIRIEEISNKIKDEQLSNQINLAEKLKEIGQKCLGKIQSLIQEIKAQNQNHPDVIMGLRPTITHISFTKLLCFNNQIREFFPNLEKRAEIALRVIISIWFSLKTRIESLDRILILLHAEKIDIVALMREVLSPRKQVQKKPYWLAFQAENKVQLWSSQLQTYLKLTEEQEKGAFCQLNMGEGKTQIIIPMMILDTIFNNQKKDELPRINLLSSLMEEARGNFFRFLSATGFQIPGFQMPFTRSVKLSQENIYQIRNLIQTFSKKLYILMSRESRLSEILRFYETNKTDKEISLQKMPIIKGRIFDIFDEIDALMNSNKSYIYSIGDTEDLPEAKVRLEILRVIIEKLLKKNLKYALQDRLIITDETEDDALDLVRRGQYPPGLRLNIQNPQDPKLRQLKENITKDILQDPYSHHFAFIQRLGPKDVERIIQYIVNPQNELASLPINLLSEQARNQIYTLRGAIGYGIFEHCLLMRCGVDYGVPNSLHKKRIAVPYEAADIPSKTSQYQQPDVSTILSYLAYYTKGLTKSQFLEALQGLLSLSKSSKQIEYQDWFNSLSEEERLSLQIKNVNQINFNSKALIDNLANTFMKNRRTIAFWLNKFVFPTNLRQYSKSICGSAWDLADVQNSVGFSGTKDNHWLYSDKLKWSPCDVPSIKGTDGKMIYLISKNTLGIQLIEENEKTLWQRFVDEALANQVGCIIDAGALCVGKSLEYEIVPFIAQHQNFNKDLYQGISFCDSAGKWKIYDVALKYYIPRGTTIPDHKTFVIFDQARTRGADIKMDSKVVAAISLGPKMTKDKFMQAAGRLRKLGRDQKLVIMATHEIFTSLPDFKKQIKGLKEQINSYETQDLAQIVLAWCCHNSIESNQKLLLQFANLGWNHIKSKINKRVHENNINTTLKGMYEGSIKKQTVAQICQNQQKQLGQLNDAIVSHRSGQEIIRILTSYGKNVYKHSGALDDVCERQVQVSREVEKQQEDGVYKLKPIPENDNPELEIGLQNIPLILPKQLVMTSNFVKTTKPEFMQQSNKRVSHQLGEVYFIIYNDKNFQIVTLREASIFISKHIIGKQVTGYRIQLLDNLSYTNEFIHKNKLSGALVGTKFIAGIENYDEEEQEHLLRILVKSAHNKEQWKDNYTNLTSAILRKKRIYLKKFMGSTLEKLVVRLENEGIYDALKEEIKVNDQ